MITFKKHFLIISLLAMLALTACKPTTSPAASTPAPSANAPLVIQRDGVRVQVTRLPKTIPLTEPTVISVDASADRSAQLDVDTSALKEDFSVSTQWDKADRQDQSFYQHLSIQIEPNWHGTFTLGEILLSFSFQGHAPVVIAIPKTTVTVPEPTQAEQSQRPEDAAARTPLSPELRRSHALLYGVLGGLLALGALIALIVFLTRRFRRPAVEASKPVIPPHLLALQRLNALLAEKLVQHGEIKPFYDRLSEIVRDYIEGQFGLRAPEQTTEEFLDAIRTQHPHTLSPKHNELINEFMNHTDLVKYARQIPTVDEINRTVQAATSFIQETIPVPGTEEDHAQA